MTAATQRAPITRQGGIGVANVKSGPLVRQRDGAAAVVLSFKVAAGERQCCERLTLVVVDNQIVVLECPLPAGEESTGTAALRRNGALRGAWRVAQGHEAAAASRGGEVPAPGKIERRR